MKRLSTFVVMAVAVSGCESATAPAGASSAAEDALSGTASYSSLAMPIHKTAQVSSGGEQAIGWCDEAAGVVRLSVPGTGTLTHAGRFELEQTNCADLATGAITEGVGTLTTANGDEIHLLYSGQVLPGIVPQTLDLDYVVVGGTGRFETAEGELNAEVVYTSATTWVSKGEGWIRYAASDASSH